MQLAKRSLLTLCTAACTLAAGNAASAAQKTTGSSAAQSTAASTTAYYPGLFLDHDSYDSVARLNRPAVNAVTTPLALFSSITCQVDSGPTAACPGTYGTFGQPSSLLYTFKMSNDAFPTNLAPGWHTLKVVVTQSDKQVVSDVFAWDEQGKRAPIYSHKLSPMRVQMLGAVYSQTRGHPYYPSDVGTFAFTAFRSSDYWPQPSSQFTPLYSCGLQQAFVWPNPNDMTNPYAADGGFLSTDPNCEGQTTKPSGMDGGHTYAYSTMYAYDDIGQVDQGGYAPARGWIYISTVQSTGLVPLYRMINPKALDVYVSASNVGWVIQPGYITTTNPVPPNGYVIDKILGYVSSDLPPVNAR